MTSPNPMALDAKALEAAREALKQAFRDTVTETSGLSFAISGVAMPNDKVWQRYAEAALAALPLPAAGEGLEPVALVGVDPQVLTAAREMDKAERRQPKWVWHSNDDVPLTTHGRWQKSDTQAPYIRADLALRALDGRTSSRATPAARAAVLEQALKDVRRRAKNARGAIESNQVVDKDVHGSMTWILETIDAALKEKT